MRTPRKLFLLLWKNFVLLKRQYIVTACEIVLPTIFCIGVAYLRTRIIPYEPMDFEDEYYIGPTRNTTFQEFDEKALCYEVYSKLYYYSYNTNIVGFTPNNPATSAVIEELIERVRVFGNPGSVHQNDDFKVVAKGFASESEMEAFHIENNLDYGSSNITQRMPFGIVFSGLSANPDRTRKVSYKIRLSDGYFYNTKDLMPYDFTNGPGYDGEYRYSSFSGIQVFIDKILIEHLSGKQPYYNISTQGAPYPPYEDGDIESLYYIFLPQIIVLGFVFIVPSVVRGAVSEKETGIKELMKMSGLPEWMHWIGWLLNSIMVLTITVSIIVMLLFVQFNSTTGAVFKNSDFTLLWVLLMIYVIWATTYCFSVSAFFERPTIATTVAILVWLVSFYALGFAMEESYGQNLDMGIKLIFCLFPNVAIHLSLKIFCQLEASGKGGTWGNIAEPVTSTQSITLLYVMLMFLASICVNMLICLYVEAIMPKKYGVRKPFYYIFQPSEWGCGRSKVRETDDSENSSSKPNQGFEEDPAGIKAGVQIRKLRKEFGKSKIAVNDISMNIFEGQIFCLLGENGAGKTTTMSILTGLFAPTSGTALVHGHDIRTDMEEIRQNLGLCPQHNMLFDKLTVLEHFKFFGILKGLTANEAHDEAISLIRTLQIEEKIDVLSMSLSGGQKRRLSLGCALIGGSKVIFLDEPTSGMDPEARRAIWDILLSIRGERTIVLTTHFMEEADVLGDRIAIMASGTLQCCGSPGFLKRFYGAGYTLSMTVPQHVNRDEILNLVRGHVSDAHYKTMYSNSATELSIILPSENNASSKFPNMFAELSSKQKELGIDEIGVGWTTMDEVFVRVEELSHHDEWKSNDADSQTNSSNSGFTKTDLMPAEKLFGFRLLWGQFVGLFMKKFWYSLRRKRLILSQMVIPVILIIAAVAISGVVRSSRNMTPPLTMKISAYKKAVTLYSSTNENIGNIYASVVGSSATKMDSRFPTLSEGMLDVGLRDIAMYRERHIIAAEINATNMKAMFSTIAPHSSPLAINMLTNTLLEEAAPGKGYSIEVTNHPFTNQFYTLFEPAQENSDLTTIIAFVFGVMVPIGLALLAASFLISPTEERLCQGKQLQIMTGVNPSLYWCSMFLCDYFLLIITICVMTACLPIFEKHKTFTNSGGAGVIFLIMAAYGLSSISFSYIFSTFVKSVAGGFSLVTIIHLLTGVGLSIASYILETTWNPELPTSTLSTLINVIGRIFPTFGLARGAIQYATVSSNNGRCNALSDEAIGILCDPNFTASYGPMPQECCANCKDLGEKVCFEAAPYFEWNRRLGVDQVTGEIKYVPGLTQDVVWLAVVAMAYFVILMFVEYDVFKLIWEKVLKTAKSTYGGTFVTSVSDEDVIAENQRVQTLVNEGRIPEDAMVVNSLCKSFGTLSAVSNLSFGVHHGECFGLLGVNGAGKTTTFKMLTGDEPRSDGSAYINNLSLLSGRKEFLSKLGYCPQFDGINGILTGKEMLSLFARLRGVPGNRVNDEADKWLLNTGLSASGNVQCQKYSGGMKRRLSAAVALIADPPVILLDEPTSGVDPVARRQFWKIISSIKNSGQAVILNSHSMEECEALCSRLGIMVNGEMQCFGSVQHLKKKFAQGFSLTIKLKDGSLQTEGIIDTIIASVCQTFPSAVIKDRHQTTMKFHIESSSYAWEDLYRSMELIKSHFQDYFEEYAVTETTLEEVFLSFARKQYVNERTTSGKGCTLLCCRRRQ